MKSLSIQDQISAFHAGLTLDPNDPQEQSLLPKDQDVKARPKDFLEPEQVLLLGLIVDKYIVCSAWGQCRRDANMKCCMGLRIKSMRQTFFLIETMLRQGSLKSWFCQHLPFDSLSQSIAYHQPLGNGGRKTHMSITASTITMQRIAPAICSTKDVFSPFYPQTDQKSVRNDPFRCTFNPSFHPFAIFPKATRPASQPPSGSLLEVLPEINDYNGLF